MVTSNLAQAPDDALLLSAVTAAGRAAPGAVGRRNGVEGGAVTVDISAAPSLSVASGRRKPVSRALVGSGRLRARQRVEKG